ncbi:MAG TPA: glutamate--tRNA ligase [Gaiellaceae bacterium]|nr:glutamate--tRNA ligase [Gaiellaceae bacterium]
MPADVKVRMAPSPTGFLHIGSVRTFVFNWLFARQQGGECLLRIENTDTSREVAEAVDQIQDSLRWIGIDWDGPVSFQLDTADRARELAQELLAKGDAYEDEGAIRFRQPTEGTVSWHDAVRGEIEFRNELLPDLVIVRSDGRPTYNFVSPVDDILDGITHVIRGDDHVSNTPSQINILRALGAELPVYAHVPMINGADGKKLSKRHGAVATEAFRDDGYLPQTMMNFLALLGWSYDDKTTIMSRHELIERFSLDRVVPSPATFDYKKLDWMNGVYLRNLQPEEYAHDLRRFLAEQGIDWPAERVNATVPLVQEKIEKFSQYPDFVRFLFEDIEVPADLDGRICRAAAERLAGVEPWDAAAIEEALRGLVDELGEKPRTAFQPIRLAVTGSKVSPGLFESLELLGRDESLRRLSAAGTEA